MHTPGKIGRRTFGKELAAGTAALVLSEADGQVPQSSADADLRAARQSREQDSREIAQVPLPRSIEPAFRFKA
jgi:hypothetical protein